MFLDSSKVPEVVFCNVGFILAAIIPNTSRTRARRVAEVSRFKKCNAIGSKDKVCL